MEIEAKIKLKSPSRLRALLKSAEAECEGLTLEKNWLYDYPDRSLLRTDKLLRLRQDQSVRVTFKGPRDEESDLKSRQEIEFELPELPKAQSLIESLGFDTWFYYEKYRETFMLDPTHIMFDELPFGYFVEIESNSLEMVEQATTILGLDWERRIKQSYMELFDVLAQDLDLPFTDATFSNFADMKAIQPADLGVEYAIRSPSTDESET